MDNLNYGKFSSDAELADQNRNHQNEFSTVHSISKIHTIQTKFNHFSMILNIFDEEILTSNKIASSILAEENDYALFDDPANFRLTRDEQRQIEERIEKIILTRNSRNNSNQIMVTGGAIYYYHNQITHKNYIGLTMNSLNQRFGEHRSDINRPAKKKTHFLNDLRKYGEKNFSKHLLHPVENVSRNFLCELEKFYIRKYQTFKKELNSTPGGDLYIHPESVTNGWKNTRKGEGNPFYNHHHTPISKQKISKGNKGKITSSLTKAKISQKKYHQFEERYPISIYQFRHDLASGFSNREMQKLHQLGKSQVTTWSRHIYGSNKFSVNQQRAKNELKLGCVIPTYIEQRRQAVLAKYNHVSEELYRKVIRTGISARKAQNILNLPKSPFYTLMKEFYHTERITKARIIERNRFIQ